MTVGYTDSNGETLIDRFLRERVRETSPEEASALRCLRDESWYSMFEIQEVRLHEGLQLVDLLFDRSIFVRERTGTLQMDAGDTLLGWVVNLVDHYELSGACSVVPPLHRGALLGLLRTELAAARINHPGGPDHLRIRRAIPAAHQMLQLRTQVWLQLCQTEGEGPLEGVRSRAVAATEAPPSPDAGPQAEEPEPRGDPAAPERVAGASHRLPPLPHEVIARLIPGLRELVPSLARRMRTSPSWSPSITWSSEDLAADAEVNEFIEGYATACHLLQGWSRAASLNGANLLGHHVFYMANFEAHYRKTFWVDESLAWMLQQTELDVQGEFLNPPFPSCAVVRLDTILESTFPDVRDRDPVFASRELKVLGPPGGESRPGRGHRRAAAPPPRTYSADDVFYLPGKIPISRVRQLRALGGHADGGRIFKRFMVRGHWRRPAPTWKDPRLRWIEPYWKGPDAVLILEREYKMKP